MQRWIRYTEDFLEIILNFLVVLCLETAVDAASGMPLMPVWKLCLPVFLPFFFYGLRKRAGNLVLFLVLHPLAVMLLVWTADSTPLPILWRIVFAVIGVAYLLQSVKIRIISDDDAEGEVPPALAGCLAVAAFFICGYIKEAASGERIVWLSFLWLILYLLKKYLDNFMDYVGMNRRTAGAMPEKNIFRAGMITVGGYSCFSVLLLILCAQTPLVGWLSGLVGKFGRLLVYLLYRLVMLFADGEGETGPMEEGEIARMMEGMEAANTPAWLQILDTIIKTAVSLALVAAAIALLVMLIRYIIRNFYGRNKEKKEVLREGFVEEEERLDGGKRRREKKLPLFGGTMQQRIRRIFKRTVQGAYPEGDGLAAKTAREIAVPKAGRNIEEWSDLSGIYERARYAGEQLTKEDVKAAGKLSGEILHNIK